MIFTAIPLVIVFSLCYAATRYEDLNSIFRHTWYFGGWLTFAMILVAGVLQLIQWHIR
jgi:Na+/melibiose symporter-like transporter